MTTRNTSTLILASFLLAHCGGDGGSGNDSGGQVDVMDQSDAIDVTESQLEVAEDTSAPANHAPVIQSFEADRNKALAGDKVTFTVTASDEDGDPLVFDWFVSPDETLLDVAEDGASAIATLPLVGNIVAVTVSVTDGKKDFDSEQLVITVMSWSVDETASQIAPVTDLHDVAFISQDEGWVVGGTESGDGANPYVLHYKVGAWTDETQGTGAHLHSVAVFGTDWVLAAGGEGVARFFDGMSWASFTLAGGCTHALAFLGPQEGWAGPAHAGQPVGMRHFQGDDVQASANWSDVVLTGHQGIMDIDMIAAGDGWAVGEGGKAFHWDGGQWSVVDTGTSTILLGVDFTGPEFGVAVVGDGSILHYSGGQFNPIEAPDNIGLNAVHMMNQDEGWIVGNKGVILRYKDGQWSELPSPTQKHLMAVYSLPGGRAWAVGTDGIVLTLR